MYKDELNKFLDTYSMSLANRDLAHREMAFERLYIGHSKLTLNEIFEWYDAQKNKCGMTVERVPLKNCKNWNLDEITGSLIHSSGEFFRVDGIRVSNSENREVENGWDQPILTQIGYDGGILGLIRKRFDGVPHYLVEAKAEPGNYGIVQISPTIQATFSNIKRAHKGNSTPFWEVFLHPEDNDAVVVFDKWMSEDGGRLFNKRNRSMIVEVDDIDTDKLSERYLWATLNQLVELTRVGEAIVAPHIRGILSAL